MTSKLARALAGLSLLGLCGLASAGIRNVDIFTVAGVPGTGGYSTIVGPCYCEETAYFSPVMLLDPGTYDFGAVREYWVPSDGTPDAGPDQPNLYLLFSPLETSGTYPFDFPAPPTVAFPALERCNQDDAACNASFQDAYVDFDLVFAVPSGQDAVQIGLVGNFRYTSPVPEPFAFAMFVVGSALLGGIARRRARRAGPQAISTRLRPQPLAA